MPPMYEYKCVSDHEFTIKQSIKDEPIKRCPKCQRQCKRLISATSFLLQGSGWAKDGYSTSGEKKKK
jgi:putative FmdB family regulatory protein